MTDANQFETFMRAYQDMVFTTAVRLLGNPTEAEDISQEVFLKAYDRFEELRNSSSIFSVVALGLGFFWAGWDRQRQSWHDKIAGTVIVRMPKGISLV